MTDLFITRSADEEEAEGDAEVGVDESILVREAEIVDAEPPTLTTLEVQEVTLREHATRVQLEMERINAEGEKELTRLQRIVLTILLTILGAQVSAQLAIMLPVFLKRSGLLQALQAGWNKAEPTITAIKDRLDTEQQRIRGLIDSKAVQISLRVIKSVNRIGIIVSPTYRRQIEKLFNETARLSRAVMGDSNTINSALGLLNLAVQDVARLSGRDVQLGQQEWFAQTQSFLQDVENNSTRYARSPGSFWFDFNANYLTPLQTKAAAATEGSNQLVRTVNELATKADALAVGVGDRFRDYRKELEPFLSPDQARELDRMRRDYKTKVELPISQLETFVEIEFPVVEASVKVTAETVERHTKEIAEVTELTADPDSIDEQAKDRQTTRFSRILGEGLPLDPREGPLEDAHLAIERIKREL